MGERAHMLFIMKLNGGTNTGYSRRAKSYLQSVIEDRPLVIVSAQYKLTIRTTTICQLFFSLLYSFLCLGACLLKKQYYNSFLSFLIEFLL